MTSGHAQGDAEVGRDGLRSIGDIPAVSGSAGGAGGARSSAAGAATAMMPASAPGVAASAPSGPAPGGGRCGIPGVMCMTEEQFAVQQAAELNETPVLPLLVLLLFTVLAIGGQTVVGWSQAGPGAAIGAGFMGSIGLGLAIVLSVPIALLVGKIFEDDYGSFGVVCLRVGAACALHEFAGIVLVGVLGPMFAVFVSFPVMIFAAVWLIGMDVGRAALYALLCGVARFVLTLLFLSSLAATFST